MLKSIITTTVLSLAIANTAFASTVLRFAEGSPNRGSRAEAVEHPEALLIWELCWLPMIHRVYSL